MELYDFHNDYLTHISNCNILNYMDKCKESQVKGIVSAVWTSELKEVDIFKNMWKCLALQMQSKEVDVKLAIEDLHFATKQNINKIINCQPTIVGVTWNDENVIGGGVNSSAGLSYFGRSIIKKLERESIAIDLAHTNEQTFMDIARITTNKLYCSHTAFNNVQKHKRNLKDYQIQVICETGGLIGLTLVSDFISGEKHCSIDEVVEHIEYFINKFGDKNLCIGTDFYGTRHTPNGIKKYKNLEKIEKELKQRGYSDETIKRIMCNNLKQSDLFKTKINRLREK